MDKSMKVLQFNISLNKCQISCQYFNITTKTVIDRFMSLLEVSVLILKLFFLIKALNT